MSAAAPGLPYLPSIPTSDPSSGTSRERTLPHIHDLQAQALTGYNPASSIKSLLEIAEKSFTAANGYITFRRPEYAYVEYMRAFELATNVIRRHPGYIDLTHDDKNGDHRLKILNRKLLAAHDQFMSIKSIIENDNLRNGARPKSSGSRLSMRSDTSAGSTGGVLGVETNGVKERPIPSPKPQALHGHAISSQDRLLERFSKLRVDAATEPTNVGNRMAPSPPAKPADGNAPARPAKMPFEMPKPPSPTYNPARNMDTNGIAPPRYSARSLASSDSRKDSYPGAILGSAPRRRRSTHLEDLEITADRLHDYISRFSVLLIDVRSRDDFDQGHIFARNIMCIEPMSLKQGMSAEQIYETLVLSPDREQLLWEDRNMFDLVVYYDQSGSGQKYLHEALWDFNQEKPLKAAPKMLVGGLDAWCEMSGQQSLVVSNTIARNGLQRRPAGRSELRLPKRRLRDFNPLDKEEEKSWLERARQESVSAPQPPVVQDDVNAAIEEFNQRFPDAGMIDRQPGFMSSQQPSRIPPPPPKIPEYPRPLSQAPARPAPAASRMSYTGVSDRAAPPLPRTASLAPYVPPKYNPQNMRLPKTGLVNFGVTCYMNATLQALSATVPLTVFFMDDQFRKSVQQDNWKGSKGVMPELYSTVVRSLWAGDVDSIRPTTFRNFCGRLNREWTIDRQQDAKEFFDFLVDCLHEDLNANWSRQPVKALTEAEEQRREAMPKGVVSKIEWDRYTHREESFLTRLFGGQHASRLRCTTCGFTSTTYEAFYSVSVEIPPHKGVTLDECLRSYCAEEMLSGDEVWKCPHCRREREATKQIIFTRAPQFLVIHFKRFASTNSGTRKIRTPIDFPLEGLDLEPYMLPQASPEVLERYSKQVDTRAMKTDLSIRPPYIYDAYAVMRHIGTTLSSGHYTCAVKDRVRGIWRMFNDTRVNDFNPDGLGRNAALDNEEAYIVFYSRRVLAS